MGCVGRSVEEGTNAIQEQSAGEGGLWRIPRPDDEGESRTVGGRNSRRDQELTAARPWEWPYSLSLEPAAKSGEERANRMTQTTGVFPALSDNVKKTGGKRKPKR